MKEIQVEGEPKNGLRIQLLGGFAVTNGERIIPEAEWKSRRASRLVKLLSLAKGHRLHRDQVIDALWPESETAAGGNNLHQTLHGARRILDPLAPGCLRLEDGFLSLQAPHPPEGEEQAIIVDVEQFEAAVITAKNCRNPEEYQKTLAIYRGDLLPEDRYEEFTLARRESLRQLYVNLLLDLAGLYEGGGEYTHGIETLLRVLSVDRSHEKAHTGLMRMYAASGLRQQALRQYQALQDAMREELDAEPGPEAARLYKAILSGRFSPADPAPVPAAYAVHPNPGASEVEAPLSAEGTTAGAADLVNNLPAPITSFIGRAAEITQVRAMMKANRLVTLTGAGGVGKTQLALQVAQEAARSASRNRFPTGIWFIDLAPLADPNLVITTVASTLGLAEERWRGEHKPTLLDVLITYLKGHQALLLLDNCEHLVDACASLVSALLRGAPRLQILATSREALRIPGEAAFRVPSLSFPKAGRAFVPHNGMPQQTGADIGVEDLLQYEAVRLFCDRAQAALPDFQPGVENAAAVANICRRLDGIPLAIELAAARVASLEVTEIDARLDDVFRLLSVGGRGVSERQRTLRATIDWSYNLLSAEERALLVRLSVFTGGWTVADAEAVCSGAAEGDNLPSGGSPRIENTDVLTLLIQLAGKSMVFQMERNSRHFKQPVRYRMLETIRQYAQDKLAEHEHLEQPGEAEYWQDRHLQFFSRLSVNLEENLWTAERVSLLFQQDAELDNMRAALGWAFAGGWGMRAEAGLWLAGSLYMKWTYGGLTGEGQAWMEKGLALLPKNDPRLGCLHVKTLRVLGHIYCLQYQTQRGISLIREAIARAPDCGDPVDEAISKYGLAYFLDYFGNDHYEARQLYEESIAIYRQVKDRFTDYRRGGAAWQLAVSLNELGVLAIAESDYARAIELEQESVELFLKLGDRWTAVYPLQYLAAAYALQGDQATSREYAEKTLPILEELNNLPSLLHNPESGGHRGTIAYYLKDYAQMEADFQHTLAIAQEFGSNFMIGRSLRMLTIANRRQGHIARAAQYALKAMRQQEENKDWYSQQLVITYIAGLALDTGQPRYAAVLLGAAEALLVSFGKPMMDGWDKLEFARDVQTLHVQLDEADFQVAWSEGSAMTLEKAIEAARGIAESIVSSSA